MSIVIQKDSGRGTIDTLQKASWRYVGNGNWLDPETKQKHLTSVAFDIVKKRNIKRKSVHEHENE